MRGVFILLLSISIAACKKKDTTTANPVATSVPDSSLKDFLFIPTKDAKWEVYYYGCYLIDSTTLDYYFDANYRYKITIDPTDKDTFVNSFRYHIFYMYVNATRIFDTVYGYTRGGTIYLREDTINKKVYSFQRFGKVWYSQITLANYSYKNGDLHGSTSIARIDSVLIAKQFVKCWYVKNGFSNQFLQAYGIGARTGLLNNGNPDGNGSKFQKTIFYYKGDSIEIKDIN